MKPSLVCFRVLLCVSVANLTLSRVAFASPKIEDQIHPLPADPFGANGLCPTIDPREFVSRRDRAGALHVAGSLRAVETPRWGVSYAPSQAHFHQDIRFQPARWLSNSLAGTPGRRRPTGASLRVTSSPFSPGSSSPPGTLADVTLLCANVDTAPGRRRPTGASLRVKPSPFSPGYSFPAGTLVVEFPRRRTR